MQSSRHLSIESNRNGYLFFRADPSCQKFCWVYTSPRDLTFLKCNSLRSKRFQSAFCPKVGERAKTIMEGGRGREPNFLGDVAGKHLFRRLQFQRLEQVVNSNGSGTASDRSLCLPCLSPSFAKFSFHWSTMTSVNDDDYRKTTFAF